MYNAIAQAFVDAGYPLRLGIYFKQGWSSKLSYRTFKKLESEGYTKFNG